MTNRTSSGFRGPELVGILLVALGIIFLLGNLGVFRITWGLLWPMVIIALGALIVLSATRRGPMDRTTAAIARDGADRMELELRLGAGRFHLGPGAPGDQLLTVESESGTVDRRVARDGGLTRVQLRQDVGAWPWMQGGARWQVAVSEAVRTRLDLGAGAGEFVLDMLGLSVAEARISVGAADLKVRLPRPVGEVPVRMSVGAASVVIEIPPGVQAKVDTSGFLSVEGPRETAGYASATDRVTIRIEGAASSVRIH
jgi:hypothetical protein